MLAYGQVKDNYLNERFNPYNHGTKLPKFPNRIRCPHEENLFYVPLIYLTILKIKLCFHLEYDFNSSPKMRISTLYLLNLYTYYKTNTCLTKFYKGDNLNSSDELRCIMIRFSLRRFSFIEISYISQKMLLFLFFWSDGKNKNV